uniref:CD63 molecule n=1 Tax=Anas platyrhynchos TaxID=8839 RepID=A0A8B9SGP0_ANAPL
MALEGGMKCVKFLVFIFNFIFWVCGVALVAIGIYAQVALNKALVVGSAPAASSPVAILVVGIIIFFVSFFGCCGAWKESYCMVTTFAVLLSIIFLVEIAAAIAGYVFKDKVRSKLEEGLWDTMRKYGPGPAADRGGGQAPAGLPLLRIQQLHGLEQHRAVQGQRHRAPFLLPHQHHHLQRAPHPRHRLREGLPAGDGSLDEEEHPHRGRRCAGHCLLRDPGHHLHLLPDEGHPQRLRGRRHRTPPAVCQQGLGGQRRGVRK